VRSGVTVAPTGLTAAAACSGHREAQAGAAGVPSRRSAASAAGPWGYSQYPKVSKPKWNSFSKWYLYRARSLTLRRGRPPRYHGSTSAPRRGYIGVENSITDCEHPWTQFRPSVSEQVHTECDGSPSAAQ
jgi:hypothetical protein